MVWGKDVVQDYWEGGDSHSCTDASPSQPVSQSASALLRSTHGKSHSGAANHPPPSRTANARPRKGRTFDPLWHRVLSGSSQRCLAAGPHDNPCSYRAPFMQDDPAWSRSQSMGTRWEMMLFSGKACLSLSRPQSPSRFSAERSRCGGPSRESPRLRGLSKARILPAATRAPPAFPSAEERTRACVVAGACAVLSASCARVCSV